MKHIRLCFVFVFILLAAGEVFALDRAVDDFLSRMPDPREDPEGYAAWKVEYARYLSGESAEITSTTAPMVLSSNNGYVDVRMDQNTGAFEEGADPAGGSSWMKLTFYYPSVPWSFSIYKIDSHTPEQQYRTGPDCVSLPAPSSTYMNGDSIVTVWNNRHGVKIIQILEPVSLGALPGDNEQIMYTTLFIPVDGSCHSCGCLVYYDTKLHNNDGCPISTSFGYTGNAEIFFAPTIPSIWRAYENGFPPGPGDLVALGILVGFEAVMPDVFWCGRWPVSYTNGWSDAQWIADATGTFGSDTATMVKWYPRNVCPGDTLRFVTYYGIGDIPEGIELTLSHNPPDITASCLNVHPNPATLTFIIVNPTTSTAHNITVSLDLGGSVLTYAGGDPNPSTYSSIAGYGGSQTVNWQVNIPASAYGTTQCYSVTLDWDEGGPVTEHYCMDIPELLDMPEPTAWADDTLLCDGECTVLHADPGTGGGGTTCEWLSTDFNANNGGFSSTGSWQWGNPTSGPGSAHSAPNCWGTVLGGDYSNNANWTLTSPDIDLTGCSDATLRFWHWYNMESYWDGGNVKVSTDGGSSWTLITPVGGYPEDAASSSNSGIPGQACYSGTSGWTQEQFDLSAYAGRHIRLRWHFGTDGSVTRDGWYIDDVEVTGGTGGTTTWYYSWTPTTGLSDPSALNPTACPTTTTTYTFSVTDGGDCYGEASVTVYVGEAPQPTIIRPFPCGGITSCEYQDIIIEYDPSYNVNPLTFRLTVNGVDYFISDPELDWTPPYLTWHPSTPWPSGIWVEFSTGPVADNIGCYGDTVHCNFQVDTGPPWAYNEQPDSHFVYVADPTISVNIADDISGIDPSTIVVSVQVNGVTLDPSMYTISWDGTTLHFDGMVFENLDSVYICLLDVADSPTYDYCEPNHLEEPYCWWFVVIIDITGPEAEIIEPLPETYTACEDQRIIMTVFDSSGADFSTVQLEINGVVYNSRSPYLTYSNDTLYFTPPDSFWADAETVNVSLLTFDDIYGNPLQGAPISWAFYTDFSPPVLSDFFPEDTTVTTPTPVISATIYDSMSGVDPTSIGIEINGVYYGYDAPGVHYDTLTGEFEFHPEEARLAFADNETVTVCFYNIYDTPDYCAPNVIDTTCFIFYVDLTGPVAEIVQPLPETYTACEDQSIIIHLFDEEGVNSDRIYLVINEAGYSTSDPALNYNPRDSILVFSPGAGFWADNETVYVSLDSAFDINGNPLTDAPLEWSFYTDFSPPYFENMLPASDSLVATASPVISFDIFDDMSGVEPTSIVVTINDTISYGVESLGVSFDGEHFEINTALAGFVFADGETLTVCIDAEDRPDYCDPNHSHECWSFVISLLGPYANIVTPMDGDISSCRPQIIAMTITDEQGVNDATIELRINGTPYSVSDPQVIFRNDTLYFIPADSIPWPDGSTVHIELISADDSLGNELTTPLDWSFIVDISPPVFSEETPYNLSWVADSVPVISVHIADSVSGIDISLVLLTINGVTYHIGDPGVVWLPDTLSDISEGMLYFYPESAGVVFSHAETVLVSVSAGDSPTLCDPNTGETSWEFYIDIIGPSATAPFDGIIVSCYDTFFTIPVFDHIPASHGVRFAQFAGTINGEPFEVIPVGIDWAGDTLLTHISFEEFDNNDTVRINLLAAEDSLGNPKSADMEFVFYVDREAPHIYSEFPPAGTEVADSRPTITFDITDNMAGVNLSNILVAVDTIPTDTSWILVGSTGYLTITDSTVTFDTDGAGMSFSGGTVVRVCVRAEDTPDMCDVNLLDTCWTFTIPVGPPAPVIIEPLPETYTACEDQSIIMNITDIDGVNPSSITLEVNGTEFTTDDTELSYDLSTGELIWTPLPTEYFTDGEIVTVRLTSVCDMLSNCLDSLVVWSFTVDLTPPEISGLTPPEGYIFATRTPTFEFDLSDRLSGLDEASVILTVNGAEYSLTSAGVSWSDGHLVFSSDEAGLSFCGGDTLFVCLTAGDMPDYCPPNILDSCWIYTIETGGPVASLISPRDGVISACDPQEIVILLTDSNGVDDATIHFVAGGVEYTIDSTYLTYDDDTLLFSPPVGFFADCSTVSFLLDRADDILCNPLTAPVAFSVTFDYSPPVVSAVTPAAGGEVDITTPTISMDISDATSGVDPASISLTVDGVAYDTSSAGLFWDGTTLEFVPESLGIEWSGGDTIEVCLTVSDMPDTCGPNVLDSCWEFAISRGGPIVEIIEPLESTYSACEDQRIILTVTDRNGVDTTSIILDVNGVEYTISDTELTYDASTCELIWTPLPSEYFTDGLEVTVTLVNAEDMLHNPIDAPVSWLFFIDLSPPVLEDPLPAPGTTIEDVHPTISFDIYDVLSGLDETTVTLTVNGADVYDITSPHVAWDGRGFSLDMEAAGYHFHGGDEIEVCVSGQDSPDYCPPNILDTCWSFFIATGGPEAVIIEPLDSTISACDDQRIIMSITDSNGVNGTSIRLVINSDTFSVADDELTFIRDTLVFTPPVGYWSDNDTVHIALIRADDMLGNPLERAPVEWVFILDLSGPVADDFSPTGDIHSWQPTLSLTLTDNILGVDSSSIYIEIDGVYKASGTVRLDIMSPVFEWDGETLAFHPELVDESSLGIEYDPITEPELTSGIYFPEFATITVRVFATDNEPDYCEPNPIQLPNSFSFTILDDDTIGPAISNFSPGFWSNDSAFYIECDIADTSDIFTGGFCPDSVVYLIWDNDGTVGPEDFSGIVNMRPLTTARAEKTSKLVSESVLTTTRFRTENPIPAQPEGSNFVYRVIARDADIDFVNCSDMTSSFTDSSVRILTGPVATIVEPLPNTITACDDQRIIMLITDPEGVNPATITLEVEGRAYTIDSTQLEFRNDTLFFTPAEPIFTNNQTVNVALTSAHDNLGNPMRTPVTWQFAVDTEPPTAVLTAPENGSMIRNREASIRITLDDNLSGVNPEGIIFGISGTEYRLSDGLEYIPNGNGGELIFSPEAFGGEFLQGDTVFISLQAKDSPDYCEPNTGEFNWFFWVEPDISCYVHPNPFTPNSDGYNDITVFDYPFMFSEEATLSIFDIRNTLIYQKTLPPISDFRQFNLRSWDGKDMSGKKVPSGIYIYVLEVQDKVVCNGTIILAR